MPSASGLPLTTLHAARDRFLRRIDVLPGSHYVRSEATRRLQSRLGTWQGTQLVLGTSRFKNKITRGISADCLVGADEAETLIVRALSITRGECQFTVALNGVVFATENNGHTIDKVRVYVSGLSPLIDDAAYILNQMRDGGGGRMFFTRESQFMNANDKRTFLTIVPGNAPPIVRGSATPVVTPPTEEIACPTCFQILPRSGICGTC